MEVALNKIGTYEQVRHIFISRIYILTFYSLVPVPAQWTKDGTFHHTMEGEDDMPGHVKSSLMGPSLNIPVSTWTCVCVVTLIDHLNSHCEINICNSNQSTMLT
jgi:hypothetical protein